MSDDYPLSRPVAAFLNFCHPNEVHSLPHPASPADHRLQPPVDASATSIPPVSVPTPWRCPLSLVLAFASGISICVVGLLASGIPFFNLAVTIYPLSHSIRTLFFAILDRDLSLTWTSMRSLVMTQRRIWDVVGQPMDAFGDAEHLARAMWPILQSNSQLFTVVVLTINGSAAQLVATHNNPESSIGPCVELQNGTHRWLEGWDFESSTLTGRVLKDLNTVNATDAADRFAVSPTPSQPFFWTPLYNPQANIGNVFSADVGLFDDQGQCIGRYAVAMSVSYLTQFLTDQLAAQPATRGGRIALYDDLGLVVAASHGISNNNRRFALTKIGDPDLEAAGHLLGTLGGNWCPNISRNVHFSVRYFLDTNLFADPHDKPQPLQWCAVLLSPWENTMQLVDRSVPFAVAFVCGTTIGVTVLAVTLGLLVTRPVQRLTAGMSALKACRFAEARRATGQKSLFSELFVAQGSYDSLVEAIDAFGKYVPNTVVHGLLAGTIRPQLGMTEKDAVLAFMDVENFSRICETTPVEEIVSLTCQLFDVCCDIIVHSEGTVDKFIGDCMMAMWGAPIALPQPGVNAVEALISILSVLRHQPLTCGNGSVVGLLIGAHSGRCLVGNFGATARWDYTAVGDVVNAAARLGPLNKQFNTHCLVSAVLYGEAAASAWATSCMRPMGDVVVVGKSQALAVFEVREQPISDREGWALAVHHYAEGRLDTAAEYFRSRPDDDAAQAFLLEVEHTPAGGPFQRIMKGK
eukprot:GGOE01031164.1.p1 GENE.GGOE01031164.1~~GGOE01031164.1.p1  ORF type:complete len:758 (-),score=184.93 GGOE01031164.1:497-2740(-)